MDPSPPQLGVLGVLREALRIPTKNWKLTLAVVFLVLLPHSLLDLVCLFLANTELDYLTGASSHPLSIKLLQRPRPKSPLQPRLAINGWTLVAIDAVLRIAVYAVSTVYTMLSTVHASAATYSGEHLTVGELFKRMRGKWKGPVATQLYVSILSIGYASFVDELLFPEVTAADNILPWIFLGSLLSLAVVLYLDVVWKVGLAVAVAETGGGGLRALGAAEVVVRARWFQGFLIHLLLRIASWIISKIILLLLVFWVPMTLAAAVAVSLVFANVDQLVYMVTLAAFTVFYFDCKKSSQHGELAVDGGEASYRRLAHGPLQ